MKQDTIYHKLPGGENVKFTIFDKSIKGELYFFARVINVDLQVYKEKNEAEQAVHFGIEVTDGHQNIVYYSDPDRLKADLLAKYGHEWLISER